MNVIQTVSVSIFALTIILIATEKFHRTYVALLGARADLHMSKAKDGGIDTSAESADLKNGSHR